MVRESLRSFVPACVVLTFFTLLSSSSGLGQFTNPFFTPPTFPAGTGQVASADLNGDGKLDLIFGDGTILLGSGNGAFTTGTPWLPANSFALNFAVGDFNGDGKVDILTAAAINELVVRLGNGDGTFQSPVTTSIASPAGSFVIGDLNGDGKQDVLAAVGSGFFTFLGKGDGTFAAGIASNATDSSFSDSFADFNGDGKLDLFIPNTGVQLGKGDGTFQALRPIPSGALTGSVALGDFDHDGKLDAAITGGATTSPQLQVLFGNGDGTFRAATVQSLPANTATLSLAAGDLNGDGKADLVASTNFSVQVLISNGDGTFTPGKFYNAPAAGGTNIVIADFNGDKKRDVAAFKTMLLGNGDGTLQGNESNPNLAGVPNLLSGSVGGDFNGDGHPDIALLAFSGNSYVANIWINDGKANFTLAHTYTMPSTPSGVITVIASLLAATDVNGDGKIDLVGAVMEDNLTLVVFLGNGDGSFAAPVTTLVNSSGRFADVSGVAFGDLNGDGKTDILINADVNPPSAQSGSFYVLLGNGDGTFGIPSSPFVSSEDESSIVVGDFNKDSKLDAALVTGSGIAILLGNGDGTFQPTTFITDASCGSNCGGLLLGADLNGDKTLDLFTSSSSGYQVLTGNGDGTFTIMPAVSTSPHFGISSLVDFNGDGHLDGFGGFSAPNLGLASGNGNATFNPPVVIPVLGSGNSTNLIADFNGDGKPDVALLTSNQLIWLFNGLGHATPDFSMTADGGGTATISAGGAADYTISLTGVGGFVGDIALTCGGVPTAALCNLSPNSVSVAGSTVLSVKVTVPTTAASRLTPMSDFTGRDSGRRPLMLFTLFAAVLSIVGWVALRRTPGRPRVIAAATACAAFLFVAGMAMSGCGGGGTGSGGGGNAATPPGTYTITVTGSAQSGAITHTTNLTLVVQ